MPLAQAHDDLAHVGVSPEVKMVAKAIATLAIQMPAQPLIALFCG